MTENHNTHVNHDEEDLNLRGRWAVVTGASSGIGLDFARQLAARGMNLVIVARREERLREVAAELEAAHGVSVDVVAADLSLPEAPDAVFAAATAEGREIDVLINNAGFGFFGDFVEMDWEKEHNMLRLNMITLVHMTKLFAGPMRARDFGYILQIASNGAYAPTPLYASYSASKAFVLSYGYAAGYELKDSGVHMTVLSPGITRTEFHDVSGQDYRLFHKLTVMESDTVARVGLDALFRRKPHRIAGWLNALIAVSTRFTPRRLATALAYRLMR